MPKQLTMRRKKYAWWLGHGSAAAFAMALAIMWAILGNYYNAFTFAMFSVASMLVVRSVWWSYLHGYHRACADLLEAFNRSENTSEFLRLVRGDPPKPWE